MEFFLEKLANRLQPSKMHLRNLDCDEDKNEIGLYAKWKTRVAD